MSINQVSRARVKAGAFVGDNMPLVKVITLTSAQILALHTTPVVLVPAPGAGRIILPRSITASLIFNANAYTGANNMEFRYTDGSGAKVTADLPSATLDAGANALEVMPGVTAAFIPVANAAVVAAVPVANPAAGDSTIQLTIHYQTVKP